jgi:hypothetical protein
MVRRNKKKDTIADGSFHPDHPELNEHVTAVLAGIGQLSGKKKKSPSYAQFPKFDSCLPRHSRNIPALQRYYTSSRGLGTMVSPYAELKTTLEEMMDAVYAYIQFSHVDSD